MDFKQSKTYNHFSKCINQPDPELLLGPNWKAVLNFWLFMDTLSEEQWKIIEDRYLELDHFARKVARDAWVAAGCADRVADWVAGLAAALYSQAADGGAAQYATLELIGDIQNPLYLPLFENL